MAFIALRQSRNTKNFYLVESYRDGDGRSRKRTICYLGREQDGTDTLAKAVNHWQQKAGQAREDLQKAARNRKRILRKRCALAEARLSLLTQYLKHAEAARQKKEQDAQDRMHWQAFIRLRNDPSAENARAAKRAFLALAKRHHPDMGGSHDAFLMLKATYDHALRFAQDG